MVKLRLLRIGRHKEPVYRIVAVDSRAKANGAYIELLGQYDPLNNSYNLKTEAIMKWLDQGAQPTETVRALLKKQKIWSEFMLAKQHKEHKDQKEAKKEKPVKKEAKPKTEAKAEPKKEVAKEQPKEKSASEILSSLNMKSKYASKYSDEEIQKREQQEFRVVEENEYDENEERTIIISLHINHIEKILNDDKSVLFMKKLPAHPVKRVLIYATQPVGLVIGEFDLKDTKELSRTKAWAEYGKESTFTKAQFDEYFEGAEVDGVKVMEIEGFIKYKNPKPIDKYGMQRGPSGFAYLK